MMDKIILGLLVLKNLTIYEMRKQIRDRMQGVCSDSLGSIQAAIKKLIEGDMVSFEEHVENGKNKKVYSITQAGRDYFSIWIYQPMEYGSAKNMELAKLYFMGMARRTKRIELVDSYVYDMYQSLQKLLALQNSSDLSAIVLRLKAELEKAPNYKEQAKFLEHTNGTGSVDKSIKDIETFALLSLQYEIDKLKHDIEWFENLQAKMVRGGKLI